VEEESLGKKQYYCRLIAQSSNKAYNITGIVSAILAIVGGIIVNICPTFGGTMNYLFWALPLAVFVATAGIEFALGSYWFYKKTENDKNALIKRAKPKLTVERTTVSNYKSGYNWKIEIKNNGTDSADDCRGQLIILADEKPDKNWSLDRWPINEYFSWGNDRESVSIPGSGRLELEVANNDGIGGHVHLAYAKGEEFREQHNIAIFRGAVILVLSITSKNALPIFAVCMLHQYCEGFNNLELKEVTAILPDVKIYQN